MIPWIDRIDNENGLVDGWRGTNGIVGVGTVFDGSYPAMRGSCWYHCDIRVLSLLDVVDIVTVIATDAER
jgi:hypothetical protein